MWLTTSRVYNEWRDMLKEQSVGISSSEGSEFDESNEQRQRKNKAS
jgi:hypothetical protein